MKINVVSYLNPYKYLGGGEMVSRSLIEFGKQRGHSFTFTSARDRNRQYNADADFDLLIDIFNYPETLKSRGAWIQLDPDFFRQIVLNRPFVHMTNAYADVCNLGYLPCSGNQSDTCVHKSPLNITRNVAARDFSKQCFSLNPLVRQTYLNSLANIYVSPLHQKISAGVLGIDDADKAIVARPIIETDNFYNRGLERDIENLFVGVISEAKGFYEMRDRFAGQEIVLVGDVHPGVKVDFGTHLGKLPYDQIPELMNRAKNFVFLPRWPEPQGRVVVEAALSGCKLVVNENVGATSFPFDIANPENMKDSKRIFWEELEAAVE